MFIIILLEVLRKFNFTIDIYNLNEFIKTLKSQLHENKILKQDEKARMLTKFFEAIKKKQELESEQIAKKIKKLKLIPSIL